MPLFGLQLMAQCDNIDEIIPVEGRSWQVQFKCIKCNTDHPNFVDVDPDEQQEVDAATFNSVFKCKFCSSRMTANVQPRSEGKFDNEKAPTPQTVIVFDCRGCEPIKLQLDDQWTAVASESGAVFEDVDLSDDWADYDEKSGESVMISEVEVTVTGVKK